MIVLSDINLNFLRLPFTSSGATVVFGLALKSVNELMNDVRSSIVLDGTLIGLSRGLACAAQGKRCRLQYPYQ